MADNKQLIERDISHWTEWSDIELIEQAACGCQRRDLADDEITRDAIAMNVITPFRQRISTLTAEIEELQDAIEREALLSARLMVSGKYRLPWRYAGAAMRNLEHKGLANGSYLTERGEQARAALSSQTPKTGDT